MSEHRHDRHANIGVAGEVVASHIRPDGVTEITEFKLHSASLLTDPIELKLVAADGTELVVDGFTLRQVQRGELTFIEVPDTYDLEMLPRIIESMHMALAELAPAQAPAILVLIPGARVLIGHFPGEEP